MRAVILGELLEAPPADFRLPVRNGPIDHLVGQLTEPPVVGLLGCRPKRTDGHAGVAGGRLGNTPELVVGGSIFVELSLHPVAENRDQFVGTVAVDTNAGISQFLRFSRRACSTPQDGD